MVEIKLSLKQTQRLMITPQLYQAIKILQLTTIELRQTITEELEQNPVLEEVSNEMELETPVERENEQGKDAAGDKNSEEIMQYFEDSSDAGYSRSYDTEAMDNKQKFLEGALNRPESLQEHLIWQLRVSTHSEKAFQIGELIISNISHDGYLYSSLEELAETTDYTVEELEEQLKVIQTFDPFGVGARDLRECLLIQLRNIQTDDSYAETVVQEYFDLLSTRKHTAIAKNLGINSVRLKKTLAVITALNPKPGLEYDQEKTRYVVPDVSVEKRDGDFQIIMNDGWIPRIRINPSYRNMMKTPKLAVKTKSYLKERYSSALWFIRSIEQRRSTLFKVVSSIVEVQRKFFERGNRYLVPLTLHEIADKIEMHESTVSRVTSGKYIQTSWGIFELKYFFSSKIQTDSGTQISSQSVKELIKDIIDTEGSTTLSDQDIVLLLGQSGIKIARRTVTKYRKKMKILPSNLRKKQGG